MKRESVVFYKSFYDSIKELDANDQVQIYNAIFQYQFNGEIIKLTGVAKSIFTLIIPQLEANNKRYINGCKGGAPKNNQNARKEQPRNNQETTKIQPNENDNVNDNENDNVNDNDNNIYIVEDNNACKEIIDYLNMRTSQHYKYNNKNTKEHINARLKEGFTIDDFKTVIDKMCVEWINTDMQKYLRPDTLFRPSKFESYLNREVSNNKNFQWEYLKGMYNEGR